MKDAGSVRESRSKSRKRRPCYRIQAPCYVIASLNETGFRRKSLAGKTLSLWRVPTINKPSTRKELRSILAGGPVLGFRNSPSTNEMHRPSEPVIFSTVLIKFIKLMIFTNLTIMTVVAARVVQTVAIWPFTLLKTRFTRASFWHSDPVFAPKVIAGKRIRKWPPPGTSILNGRAELQPILAGGSPDDQRKCRPRWRMRPVTRPEKNYGRLTKYNKTRSARSGRPAGRRAAAEWGAADTSSTGGCSSDIMASLPGYSPGGTRLSGTPPSPAAEGSIMFRLCSALFLVAGPGGAGGGGGAPPPPRP
jgi:hypothetical protein